MSRRAELANGSKRPGLQAAGEQARQWWAQRPPRERRLLKLCAAILTIALVWWVGMEPALRSISRSNALLPRLRHDAAQLDALLLEAGTLARQHAARLPADQLEPALAASLERAGIPADLSPHEAATARTRAPGGASWEITFSNAGAAPLMAWLADVQGRLPLRVVTLDLTRSRIDNRDRPGQVDGRLVLTATIEAKP